VTLLGPRYAFSQESKREKGADQLLSHGQIYPGSLFSLDEAGALE